MSDIITAAEAATLLQTSVSKVNQLCRTKKIPAQKIGGWRMSRAALMHWIENPAEPPTPAGARRTSGKFYKKGALA